MPPAQDEPLPVREATIALAKKSLVVLHHAALPPVAADFADMSPGSKMSQANQGFPDLAKLHRLLAGGSSSFGFSRPDVERPEEQSEALLPSGRDGCVSTPGDHLPKAVLPLLRKSNGSSLEPVPDALH
eukprot:scaffold485_cov272-Pinguiococcus_pyrenoidosus.AAC.7